MIKSSKYGGGAWPEGDPQKAELDAKRARAAEIARLNALTRTEEIKAAFAGNNRVTFVRSPVAESAYIHIVIDNHDTDRGWYSSDDGTSVAAPANKVITLINKLLASATPDEPKPVQAVEAFATAPATTLEVLRAKYAGNERVTFTNNPPGTMISIDGKAFWQTVVRTECGGDIDNAIAAIDAALAKPAPASTGPDPVRDCVHGSLKRTCETCESEREIADLRAELADVTAERDELNLRIQGVYNVLGAAHGKRGTR